MAEYDFFSTNLLVSKRSKAAATIMGWEHSADCKAWSLMLRKGNIPDTRNRWNSRRTLCCTILYWQTLSDGENEIWFATLRTRNWYRSVENLSKQGRLGEVVHKILRRSWRLKSRWHDDAPNKLFDQQKLNQVSAKSSCYCWQCGSQAESEVYFEVSRKNRKVELR